MLSVTSMVMLERGTSYCSQMRVITSTIPGSSRVTRNLTVLAGTQPDAPTVTPPDSLTVPTRTEYLFAIQTEGAEKAAVRYYRIGSPNDLNYDSFNVGAEGTTTWRGYQYYSGNQYAYSFAVQKNGVWSAWSPFITITVE